MWFGFDWQSKAAVVCNYDVFPNDGEHALGLSAASAMERDLFDTYAAGYWQTLFKLQLPRRHAFYF